MLVRHGSRLPRAEPPAAVKGNLNLEIDELGIEVRITITPDPNGADITPESLAALLGEKKVRSGIDSAAIDRGFRTLAQARTEPVTFVAAAGVPPRPATPEIVVFEPLPVPERLGAVARKVLDAAPKPRGFRLREERIKTEKKVLKKAALPFLPPREEVEVVVEKRLIREEVAIDPNLAGPARQGGKHRGPGQSRHAGQRGQERLRQARPRSASREEGFLFLEGVERTGAEVKAVVTGSCAGA